MTPNRIHDALPWFVNGTLEPGEAAAFERHLMDCADCKQELDFLEKLKAELELHGEDFLAAHPPPEQLVLLLDPEAGDEELGDQDATRLRRHLALCATCAEEARWMRGEAAAGSSRAASDGLSTERAWRWVAVAAMLAMAVTIPLWIRQQATAFRAGVIHPSLVEETARAGTEPTEVAVPPGSTHVFLAFPVDLGADAYPISLEIVDDNGKTRYRQQIVAGDPTDGYYLYIAVPRRDLPDGGYRARLTGIRGGADPGIEYPFRIAGAPAP